MSHSLTASSKTNKAKVRGGDKQFPVVLEAANGAIWK